MYKTIAVLALVTAAVVGCTSRQPEAAPDAQLTAVGQKYLMEQEPAYAQPVAEAIQADDETEVTVVGRIGGGDEPLIEDLAAFTIVDPSLEACSDIPGDTCRTPWDYCCELDKLKTHSVTVKFTDEQGTVLPVDARELFGVKPLQTVVVKGRLQKDKSGKTAVVAEKMYVKR